MSTFFGFLEKENKEVVDEVATYIGPEAKDRFFTDGKQIKFVSTTNEVMYIGKDGNLHFEDNANAFRFFYIIHFNDLELPSYKKFIKMWFKKVEASFA